MLTIKFTIAKMEEWGRERRGEERKGGTRWRGEYGLSIQVSALLFVHPPILSSFILTHFFVFPWTHLLFVNVRCQCSAGLKFVNQI